VFRTRPTRGGTKGTSYPGPAGTGAREYESTHDKLFCNQAQNYLCQPVAIITVNLFLNLSMVVVLSIFWSRVYGSAYFWGQWCRRRRCRGV